MAAEGPAGLGSELERLTRVLYLLWAGVPPGLLAGFCSCFQRRSRSRRLTTCPVTRSSPWGSRTDLSGPQASQIQRPPPQFLLPAPRGPRHSSPAVSLCAQPPMCFNSEKSRRIPRPCSPSGPGIRFPREGQHKQKQSKSRQSPHSPPRGSHVCSSGERI